MIRLIGLICVVSCSYATAQSWQRTAEHLLRSPDEQGEFQKGVWDCLFESSTDDTELEFIDLIVLDNDGDLRFRPWLPHARGSIAMEVSLKASDDGWHWRDTNAAKVYAEPGRTVRTGSNTRTERNRPFGTSTYRNVTTTRYRNYANVYSQRLHVCAAPDADGQRIYIEVSASYTESEQFNSFHTSITNRSVTGRSAGYRDRDSHGSPSSVRSPTTFEEYEELTSGGRAICFDQRKQQFIGVCWPQGEDL